MTESWRQNVTKFHRVQTWEKLGHSLLLLGPVSHSSSFRMVRMFVVTSRCDILNHGPLPAATLLSWLCCVWSALPQHLACLFNGMWSAVVPFFSDGLKEVLNTSSSHLMLLFLLVQGKWESWGSRLTGPSEKQGYPRHWSLKKDLSVEPRWDQLSPSWPINLQE